MVNESFYPPRATWTRPYHRLVAELRRFLSRHALEVRILNGTRLLTVLKVSAVPALGFRLLGMERIGRFVLRAWLVTAVLFIVSLGTMVGTLAYSLMISLHCSGVITFVARTYPRSTLVGRILQGLGIVLIMSQVVYAFLQWEVQTHVFQPVKLAGGVYYINRTPWQGGIETGSVVGYYIHGFTGRGNVRIHAGESVGRILASAGDTVEFTPTSFIVNGVPMRHLDWMPTEGEYRMEADTYFIWPNVKITNHHVGGIDTERALLRLAMVRRDDIHGTAFQSWLWRNQIP